VPTGLRPFRWRVGLGPGSGRAGESFRRPVRPCGSPRAGTSRSWKVLRRRLPSPAARVRALVGPFRGSVRRPGLGDNSRVLEWIFRRCEDRAEAVESPIGLLPVEGDLKLDGVDITPAQLVESYGSTRTPSAPSSPRSRSTWPPSTTSSPTRSARSSTRSDGASAPSTPTRARRGVQPSSPDRSRRSPRRRVSWSEASSAASSPSRVSATDRSPRASAADNAARPAAVGSTRERRRSAGSR